MKFGELPSQKDIDILRNEIKHHLRGQGSSDAWAVMEDATLSILKSMGYAAIGTARSDDGGVDVIMCHPTRGVCYVQVKHSKNVIGVSVFRELIGTMCIDRVNDALLVTSSHFTEGVFDGQCSARGVGKVVELVDGENFIAALDLVARESPPTLGQILQIARPNVSIIHEERQI